MSQTTSRRQLAEETADRLFDLADGGNVAGPRDFDDIIDASLAQVERDTRADLLKAVEQLRFRAGDNEQTPLNIALETAYNAALADVRRLLTEGR